MNRSGRLFVMVLAVGFAALLLALPLVAQRQGQTSRAPVTTVANVVSLVDNSVVKQAQASLTRMEHGVSMSFDSAGLTPGDAYTIWWMIFNLPQNCSGGECGSDDVFLVNGQGSFILDGNGNREFNRAGIEAAHISSLWAAGSLVDRDGTVHFEGHLPIGDMTGDVWFGQGLADPMGAVIHLIARTHRRGIPEMLHEQLFKLNGGCPNPLDQTQCMNVQVAIFLPPT